MSSLLDDRGTSASRPRAAPARHALLRRRRRSSAPAGVRWAAAVLTVVVVAVAAWSTPAVRRELRASYTRLPSPSTEMYFTRAPAVEHATAVVPVSLIDHGASTATYRLRVWLESSNGRVMASATTMLAPRPDVLTPTVVRLPLRKGSVVVHVALLGHVQTLHFRLGSSRLPNPKGTS